MANKAKTLGEYKENLGEKLKDLPGSENLKKEYKGKLFREIVADPEYKTLKAEYLNEKRSEASKEKIFQEAFSHAKKINSSLIEEDFRAVLIGKTEKKESKETMKKPQLESENHKIDQGKSKKEKLAEGWKEEERPAYINGSETKIKILKKELAPGAFVWEYQDDGKMPKHMVGEQLFNWKAVFSL